MKHILKRSRLLAVYLFVVAAMGYSGLQLRSASAQDFELEATGKCCTTSAGCPGTELCYLPGPLASCCDNNTPACAGANYCR